MHISGRWDDGSRPSPRERLLRLLTEFPGPIAVACDPPADCAKSSGGEDVDGLPFSVHIAYLASAGSKLLVRTKAVPQPLPAPGTPHPPRFVDTLQNAFGIYGHHSAHPGNPPREASHAERAAWRAERAAGLQQANAEFETLARTSVSIAIDGVPFVGVRVDYPDCSGLEVDWNGQTVQCVGSAEVLDVLALRSAADEDLQRIASSVPTGPRPQQPLGDGA